MSIKTFKIFLVLLNVGYLQDHVMHIIAIWSFFLGGILI